MCKRPISQGEDAHHYQGNVTQYHKTSLYTLQLTRIKRQKIASVDEGCGATGTLILCWRECEMTQPLCKTI